MEEVLLSLLRIGIGTELPTTCSLNSLNTITDEQWVELRELAEKQGVSAIVLDGLNEISIRFKLQEICPQLNHERWKVFLLEWMSTQLMVEKANQHQIDTMNDLAKRWSKVGCKVMVMKGQANGLFYPNPWHRTPGDIDCYLFSNYDKGNALAREIGAIVDESWYKHSVIRYHGETFENHKYFVSTRNGKSEKVLENELEKELNVDDSFFTHFNDSVLFPPVQWVAMFLTYHACAHFITEGLRLKQLLDWAMFLNKHEDSIDWQKLYGFCERHHLNKFVDAATAIAVHYLGIKITNSSVRVESTFSKRVLQSALYDDDYVFGSGKGDWYNRFHLIKNLWKYRWKYRDIYEMSPLRQLWYYASGFIFKTE